MLYPNLWEREDLQENHLKMGSTMINPSNSGCLRAGRYPRCPLRGRASASEGSAPLGIFTHHGDFSNKHVDDLGKSGNKHGDDLGKSGKLVLFLNPRGVFFIFLKTTDLKSTGTS